MCEIKRNVFLEISRRRSKKSAIFKRSKNKGCNQPMKYKSLGVSLLQTLTSNYWGSRSWFCKHKKMLRNISKCCPSSSGLSNILLSSRRCYKKIKIIKNKTANQKSGIKIKNRVKSSNPKTVLGPKNLLQILLLLSKFYYQTNMIYYCFTDSLTFSFINYEFFLILNINHLQYN